METKKSIVELIKLRESTRDFSRDAIDESVAKKIEAVIENNAGSPFGNKIELKLFRNSALADTQKIGTYGMISGANTFIAGKIRKCAFDLEDFGYVFEKVILQLTDLGLSTCWLGGSFKREEFRDLLELKADEIIPAVTPVGIAGRRKTLKENFIRFVVGAKKRKRWNELFFCDNAPLTEKEAGDYKIPLEMVRLAPSASNKQPWRITKDGGMFHFFIERSQTYQVLLKQIGIDLQRVDMGIAMCHFELTCSELKFDGEWIKNDKAARILKGNTEYVISWNSR